MVQAEAGPGAPEASQATTEGGGQGGAVPQRPPAGRSRTRQTPECLLMPGRFQRPAGERSPELCPHS